MFKGIKAKIDTQVNDRVTSPVRTALVISSLALALAGIALVVAWKSR